MSAFPNSPRLVKGGIVRVDPDSGAVQKMTALEYKLHMAFRSDARALWKRLPGSPNLINGAYLGRRRPASNCKRKL